MRTERFIVNLVFSCLGFLEWEFLSDCVMSDHCLLLPLYSRDVKSILAKSQVTRFGLPTDDILCFHTVDVIYQHVLSCVFIILTL